MASSIKAAKGLLRKEMKSVLKSLSEFDKIRQSDQIIEKLLKDPRYMAAETVGVYLNMPDEVKTTNLLTLLPLSKHVFIPRYFPSEPTRPMEMVSVDSMQDYESLRVTKWGIRQHQEDEYKLDAMDPQESGLDLLIIPGLAFTADGHRLGRGAGYYDSYLRRYSECGKKMPDTIALAFSEQLRDSIPTEEHDFIIDTVLYP